MCCVGGIRIQNGGVRLRYSYLLCGRSYWSPRHSVTPILCRSSDSVLLRSRAMAPSGTAEEFAAELEGALHIQEQEAIIAEVLPRAATPCASPEPRAEPSSARALPVAPWLTADVECAWPRRLRRAWSFGRTGRRAQCEVQCKAILDIVDADVPVRRDSSVHGCFQLHQEYGEALTAPREHAGADRPSLKRLALPSERAHSLLSAQRLLSPPCARLLSSRSDSWSKTPSSTTCSQGPRPTWCVLRGCRRRVRVCRECVARVGARRGWTDALVSVGRASNSRKATSSSRCQTPCMSSPCPCAPCWARVALART